MNNIKKIYKKDRTTPIKVAFFSNGPELPTGYAKVIREITKRLNKDERFDVIIFNENYGGQKTEWNGIPLYGVMNPKWVNGRRENIANGVLELIKITKPDILFCLEDSFTLHNFGFLSLPKLPCKKIFYIPLDGGRIPTTGINIIRSMDKIIAMSDFTKNELAKDGFDSEKIWHGVDLFLFKPVSKQYQKLLKKKYSFKEDDFIIYNYGRNSLRKNNQGLLNSIAKYLSQAPSNHKALLHIMNKEDETLNLIDYINREILPKYGEEVVSRISFTEFPMEKTPTDQDVAEMVQLSDLIVSASTGEGFGLIMAEGMACGKPIVHAGYTTPYELLISDRENINERGWIVNEGKLYTSSFNTVHQIVDEDSLSKQIYKAAMNPNECLKRGLNGRVFAEKHLNWDYLVEDFKKIFLKIV